MNDSKLILYLDDDTDDLKFFRDLTEELGHRVSLYADGTEMLYALRHGWEKPDLIFLDVHMPILNGDEILNIIKRSEDFKHIPVAMLSGAYPKKLVKQYLDAGANYLMKKANFHDMKIALQDFLQWNFSQSPALQLK